MRSVRKLLIIAFLTCGLSAPICLPAHALTSKDKLLDIQEVTSNDGIKAWLVEDHSLPIISLTFAFKGAGSVIETPEKQGLVRLVSNTMDEGAGEYDSATFQKMLTDNTISLTFSNSRDSYTGKLKILSKDKELGYKLLRLALTEPRFDEDPLQRMRAANISRIKGSLSDPNWKAARLQNDITFAGHPYAQNSGGTLTSLQNITSADLKEFVQKNLGKDNLRIGVMGDITPDELKAVIDDVFGKLPATTDIAPAADIAVKGSGEIVLYEQDIPQTIINAVQDGIGRDHPAYYTGMIMNYILGGSGFGSRLTEEIREKRGLTYGVYSYFQDFEHADLLAVSTSTKNESVGEVLTLIREKWQEMKDTPVTDKELADAKAYLIGSFPLSLDATDHIAALLLDLQLDDLPLDYLDKRAERLNSVTKEDIQSLAQELLAPEKLSVILVGKPEGITPTRTVDTLPNVE